MNTLNTGNGTFLGNKQENFTPRKLVYIDEGDKRLFRLLIVSILALFIVSNFLSNVARAETGSVNLSYINTSLGNAVPQTGIDTNDYQTFYFLTGTYNSVDEFYIITSSNSIFLNNSNYSYFTCQAPNVCTGYAYYSKYGNIIAWDYYTATITSNPIVLDYERFIFDSSNLNLANAQQSANNVNASMPMCMKNLGAGGQCSGGKTGVTFTYFSSVMTNVGISYNVTYPYPGFYVYNITKQGTVLSTVVFENSTAVQGGDVVPNYTSSAGSFPYTTGLYINASITGDYEKKIINTTGLIGYVAPEEPPVVDPVTGIGIKFNTDTYVIGGTANISWIRTSPTPFLDTDYVVLISPDATETDLTSSPPDSGYVKAGLDFSGTWKVEFRRSSILYGVSVLASDTAIVAAAQPSYILVDSKYYVNQSKNVTYFIGDPAASIQDFYFNTETNKYESVGGWWGYVTGTESIWNYSCRYPAKLKFAIVLPGENWSGPPKELTAVYTDCATDTTQPEYNIASSYLSVVPSTTNLLEYIDVSYAVPSADWVGNISYLRNYYNGNMIWSHTIDRQARYNQSYFVRPTPGSYYQMMVGSGTNTIRLETSYGTVLNTSTLTISVTDTQGYGLEFDKLLFCSGEPIKFKYYAPDSVNFSIWDSEGKLKYVKYLNASFQGKTQEINFNKIGTWDVRLLDVNALQKMNRIITIDSCDVPPPSTGQTGGAAGGIDNILGFMGVTAFWGFVIWALVVWQVAKNEKTQRAMPLIAGLAFVALLVLGLFEPYTTFLWAMLVIIIVLAGLSKVFGGGSSKEA